MVAQVSAAPARPITALWLCIVNLGEILGAHGPGFRLAIRRALRDRLCGFGIPAQAIQQDDAYALIEVPDDSTLQSYPAQRQDELLQCLQTVVGCEPVTNGDHRAYLRVAAGMLREPSAGDRMTAVALAGRYCDVPAISRLAAHRRTWQHAWQAELEVARDILDDLGRGRLLLAFQPVVLVHGPDAGAELYSEALLRRAKEGSVEALPRAIAALEASGPIDRMDRSVLWTVLGLLQTQPHACLGCNVSAASLHEHAWWRVLLAFLEARKPLARRLTIEITETSAVERLDEALALLARLRRCGVRIALDDTGVGHGTLDFMARARPDVIKIDRAILTRARDPARPAGLLQHLVAICADYSPCVIAEGVESASDRRMAIDAGVHGIQGYLVGRPTIRPAWLNGPPAVVLDADRHTPDSGFAALFPSRGGSSGGAAGGKLIRQARGAAG